jgi:mannose-1-phosphate guanylyltransferase/mannose-1-phosphate guanylyltransferase/mannose-6-phosphate isomerase
MKIRPIILSGGSGTRLWPVSRKDHPKQFAEIFGQHSLLTTTFRMLQEADFFIPSVVVANEDHKFFILDVLMRCSREDTAVLLEPCGRNTAGAALTAALAEEDESVLHLLIPSDHVIKDHAAFFAAIKNAATAAAEGHLALFGIKPDYPETGYGYIQPGASTAWAQVNLIESFKEKPDAKTAEALIAGGALWNSGIFLYDPKVIVEEIKQLSPEQVDLCQAALTGSFDDLSCRILDKKAYAKLQNISFDYLVMENTKAGVVVPCSMGWSDIGSWQALWQIETKDDAGNVTLGPVTTLDVQNSYLRSDGPVIGVIGMHDVTVVATKDAVLIAPRNCSQDVKPLVALLEEQKHNAAAAHRRVMRPWGSYEGVAEGDRFQVKHIVVKPGQSLSLQMHHHRAEHWVVVVGTALVECDDVKKNVCENESIFIPKGSKHRLSNPGDSDLHVVEVQSGGYLGEDDIVRFDDTYGRHKLKTA